MAENDNVKTTSSWAGPEIGRDILDIFAIALVCGFVGQMLSAVVLTTTGGVLFAAALAFFVIRVRYWAERTFGRY